MESSVPLKVYRYLPNSVVVEFNVGGQDYVWEAFLRDQMLWGTTMRPCWGIAFRTGKAEDKPNEGIEITGTGNQFTVFSVVASLVQRFIKKYKPKDFIFAAKEPSRVKLYKRFAKMIQEKLNFQLAIWDSETLGTVFYFSK